MAEFMSFLKLLVGCGSLLFLAMLILLALPQSRLRCVGLEMGKYVMAFGLFLLIPSPLDIAPDVIPALGWCDDLGYLVGGILSVRSARGERKKRRLYEEIELNDLQDRAAKKEG